VCARERAQDYRRRLFSLACCEQFGEWVGGGGCKAARPERSGREREEKRREEREAV